MTQDVICWDSSVLISLIRGDEDENRNRSIRFVIEQVEARACKLVVSVLLYVEVLERTMPGHAIEQFNRFMQNREMIEILAVDIRIAQKAQTIRNRSHKTISVPDAVHLATAILSGAKVFHTFDKGLLQLHGKNEVEGLAINDCSMPGTNRPLRLPF